MGVTKVFVENRDSEAVPDLQSVKRCVLKDGQGKRARIRRTAKLTSIRDRHTGDHHHDSLTIRTWVLGKISCDTDSRRSLSLDADETAKLADLLTAAKEGDLARETGGYLVLPTRVMSSNAAEALRELAVSDQIDALAMLLRETATRPEAMGELVARVASDSAFLRQAEAAMRLALYRQVLSQFEAMIGDLTKREADFQSILGEHPWLFGSEYSEILSRRRWTRDEVADFVPRRSSDGYIELIEIKTPLDGRPLFIYDQSHDNLYPVSELTKVIAQAENYLERLDKRRETIMIDDSEDTLKMRARIIIGRDGDAKQQAALRRHNGHLHRIEVVTFDGLLSIGRRVVSCLEGRN